MGTEIINWGKILLSKLSIIQFKPWLIQHINYAFQTKQKHKFKN